MGTIQIPICIRHYSEHVSIAKMVPRSSANSYRKQCSTRGKALMMTGNYLFKRVCDPSVCIWSPQVCSTSERTLVSPVSDFCYILSPWQLLLLPVFLPMVSGFICPSNEDLEALESLTEERERKSRTEGKNKHIQCL